MASEAAQSIPVARPKVRALQAVEVIDGGVKLFRDNFWTLLTINCVIHVPVRLALAVAVWFLNSTMVMTDPEELEMEVFFGAALATFAVASVLALVEPFLQGVVSYAAVERFMGREITVAKAYRQALRRFWPLLLVGLVTGVLKSVGLSLCIVPGLLVMVWFLFAPILVMVENADFTTALKRSVYLVRGREPYVLGLYALVGLFFYAAQYAIVVLLVAPAAALYSNDLEGVMPRPDSPLALWIQLAGGLVWAMVTPVVHTSVVLLYFDQRVRKEGLDVQMALPALGEDAPTLTAQPAPTTAPVVSAPASPSVVPGSPVTYGDARPGAAPPSGPAPCPACGHQVAANLEVCPRCLHIVRPDLTEPER
jgi:hypothetical protein